ncbi:MAG TPA: DNA-directed RNA polymerase subunit alpha [Candidatus Paceibacterota bacterium]|nr:DNA-directed RNA polymerase subunit alpha [Candidatus Paceibacterota bacterium]
MLDYNIILPSKPRIVKEDQFSGVYEIDGFYPGYGHTLGNSLRRIILSSLPGAAITSVKIEGAPHEFSTLDGVKEDVIAILLNLKRIRFKLLTDEPQEVELSLKGAKKVTAGDISAPGQVEVLNPEQPIADMTSKDAKLNITMRIEKGLGYIPKETLQKEKVDIGTIVSDVSFTPIRRVNYEVENMRVGDRTDHNRLRLFIETDGTITPQEALEKSIEIMIRQLQAIVGFKEEEPKTEPTELPKEETEETEEKTEDVTKIKVEDLNLSTRTANALAAANIRTVGGLSRKKESDLLELEGLGEKGITEIRKALGNYGIVLKQEEK